METEGEPPCLLRATAEVVRAGAMLAEGRAGRGMAATASWAKGEKAGGRHLECGKQQGRPPAAIFFEVGQATTVSCHLYREQSGAFPGTAAIFAKGKRGAPFESVERRQKK